MAYDVVWKSGYNSMKDGSRPTGPKKGKGSQGAAAPERSGTQFFLHPDATDVQIAALADAIVKQREINMAKDKAK